MGICQNSTEHVGVMKNLDTFRAGFGLSPAIVYWIDQFLKSWTMTGFLIANECRPSILMVLFISGWVIQGVIPANIPYG